MKLLILFSAQIKVFVTGLFTLDQDIAKFKEHIRDFLVEIKVRSQNSSLAVYNETACICFTITFRSMLVRTRLIYSWIKKNLN